LPSSATSTPTRTPVRPPQPPSQATPLSPRPRPPPTTDFYTPPSRTSDLPSVSTPTPLSVRRESHGMEDVEFTRPNFRAERPISIPYAGGAKALDDRGMLTRGASPRSKVGEKFGGGDDQCQGCGKRVYAAEQVCHFSKRIHADELQVFAINHKCVCLATKSRLETDNLGGIGLVYAVHHAKRHWIRQRCLIERAHRTARIAMQRSAPSLIDPCL
jgi:hypothetical protein